MKRSMSLLALVFMAACSSPTGPGSKPAWADNTNWQGSVAMKTGATLQVSFQLWTALSRDGWSSHETWGIGVNHARVENVKTGVVAVEFPDTNPSGLNVSVGVSGPYILSLGFAPNSSFDPAIPSCPTNIQPGNYPYYEIELQRSNDATLTGTIKLVCFIPGDLVLDSQPVVIRRI